MNVEQVKHQFGKSVRKHRVVAGLTQEGLADAAGLDRSYVGSVERGERNLSIENVCRLASAIGVKPGDLFDWWDTK